MECQVAPLHHLHREDGHPQPGPVPGGRGNVLQPRPRLQRQECRGLLQDGRTCLCHEVWQVWPGGKHTSHRLVIVDQSHGPKESFICLLSSIIEITFHSVTIEGTLNMKILKRTAHFDDLETASTPQSSQNIKLNIPKKTKLFVDQTLRERENCTLMHRVFQHDLYQLRLNTARYKLCSS